MSEQTFFQPVCRDCTGMESRDADHWTSKPVTNEGIAEIRAGTHNRLKHDAEQVAGVRDFESEPIGTLPKNTPEITEQ